MRILNLSLSPIAADPRVRRQCLALTAAGHEVTVIGYGRPGDQAKLPCRLIPVPPPPPGLAHRAAIALRQFPANLSPRLAHPGYWTWPAARAAWTAARTLPADAIHANDWSTLPIALRLARRGGAPVIYDSHEFASGEQDERRLWRWFFKAFIGAIEAAHIGRVGRVVTVSEGLAERLQARYGLAETPLVIRNMPPYRAMPYRPAGAPITVLFHGLFLPDRGLETLLRSVPAWRPDRRLVLRGYGSPAYEASLRQLAASLALGDRVEFAPPLPLEQLIPAASQADVGIYAPTAETAQMRFMLPNKFFEYVMAGLALCIGDSPEMVRLLRRHDLGVVIAGNDAAAVASAVNGLDAARIEHHKRQALAAAQVLSWDHEQASLLALYPPDRGAAPTKAAISATMRSAASPSP